MAFSGSLPTLPTPTIWLAIAHRLLRHLLPWGSSVVTVEITAPAGICSWKVYLTTNSFSQLTAA
ncbi:MAG: hypothetical protein ACFB0E_15555 [Leptolyngbyaceae cyanobacterium]